MARGIPVATHRFRFLYWAEHGFLLKRMIDPFADTTYIINKDKMHSELRSLFSDLDSCQKQLYMTLCSVRI